jgi:hypothetical protein
MFFPHGDPEMLKESISLKAVDVTNYDFDPQFTRVYARN